MRIAKSIFIAIILSLVITLQAEEITLKQAVKVANNFYYERYNSSMHLNYSDNFTDEVFSVKVHSVATFYYINFKETGWVAVSATTAAIPIIAYSNTGSYNPGFEPENFKAWMSQYSSQLYDIISNGNIPDKEVQEKWNYYLTDKSDQLSKYKMGRSVEPLVVSSWDQGLYYNEMCPPDGGGPGGHCLTGCVPTCMGQIANYFRWPQTGIGSYSYDGGVYGTLSANFGESTYNWNEMPASVNKNSLETAEILYHLGVSCDLVYGPNGSGMYNHKAAYSLRTYFKYSPETEYLYRDSTNLNWDSVIIAHLDKKIPMYYAGWSVPNINGHAFVCDGYQDDNYFHFNWGWSGSNDGYFYTDNLNPGGSNFNLAQELIINCFPDTASYTYPINCMGADTLNTIFGTIDDGSGPVYDYIENQDCSWLISPSDSINSITLHFYNFETNPEDTLYIYDGNSENSDLIGAFSGSGIPEDITTTGDEAFIRFTTDNQTNASGWLMGFTSELPIFCSNNTYTELEGNISDGSGPGNYQNLTTCMWMFQPTIPDEITLDFTEFSTEPNYDKVFVYDGNDEIGEFSGSDLPPQLIATSGMMTVIFTTNSSITDMGWAATYKVGTVGEEEINASSDLIVFPNPADNRIQFNGTAIGEISSVRIFDVKGLEVISLENISWIDTSKLTDGLYFIELSGSKGSYTTKIVIKH